MKILHLKYKADTENSRIILIYKLFRMFVVQNIHKGKRNACLFIVAGFFYASTLTICGSVPPCGVSMHPLPLWCFATGKAEPFFSAYNSNISEMQNTERKGFHTCQACGKPKEFTTEELVTDFFYWHDAKSIKEYLWISFSTALSSEEMDDWNGIARSNLAFNYQKITEFISKLESIHLKNSI